MTVYGGNGCYGEYGWRAGRGVTVIYNPQGQEVRYVDPTTVDSVEKYIWNLDPHNPGIGVCRLDTPPPPPPDKLDSKIPIIIIGIALLYLFMRK